MQVTLAHLLKKIVITVGSLRGLCTVADLH